MSESSAARPDWRRKLAFVTAALMPLSINLETYFKKSYTFKAPLNLSPLDGLLPLLLILLLVDLATNSQRVRFKIPSPAAIFWAGVALFSMSWIALQPGEAYPLKESLFAVLNPVVVVMLS